MREPVFEQKMQRVADSHAKKDYVTSVELARGLKRDLLAQTSAWDDASRMQLGWVRYYEFIGLFESERWSEALSLLLKTEPRIYLLNPLQAGGMFSRGIECAALARRPDCICKFAEDAQLLAEGEQGIEWAVRCAVNAYGTLCALEGSRSPSARRFRDLASKCGAAEELLDEQRGYWETYLIVAREKSLSEAHVTAKMSGIARSLDADELVIGPEGVFVKREGAWRQHRIGDEPATPTLTGDRSQWMHFLRAFVCIGVPLALLLGLSLYLGQYVIPKPGALDNANAILVILLIPVVGIAAFVFFIWGLALLLATLINLLLNRRKT